ncbi:MAG: DNA repair protein RecN [Candidatus Krumholzibacteriota bacterium]|nr:DNA repair protein RecN [Candidatus Krumholzibacteriota bacterium]
MLQELLIRNLAVVEDAVIRFDHGLNVMTGSTGAGKSIILTAVDLLSGGRAKRSLLRKDAESMTVEGIFRLEGISPGNELSDMISPIEATVSIKRELKSDGRSRIWINNQASSTQEAKKLTSLLLELHGQHRHQELLDPSKHIFRLDGSGAYTKLLDECNQAIERYRDNWKRLNELRSNEKENREREDFFRFQLRELDNLGLEPEIDKDLSTRIKKLQNMHHYARSVEEVKSLLSEEDGSVLEKLTLVEKLLNRLADIDQSWTESAEQIGEMIISLGEIGRSVDNVVSDDDIESEDLEELQNLLASIQGAKRKFGMECSDLVKKREELRAVLRSMEDGSDEIAEASKAIEKSKKEIIPLLERLSSERKKHAAEIDREITKELQGLGMKGALFKTDIKKVEIKALMDDADELDLHPGGWDRVEFMIRTNVGEEIHPLSDVASGGELSRITLIMKKLLVRKKGIPTLIFDEVDSGLGADLGAVVAEKMKELSEKYQIVCITHLPQVAAAGNQHILISKIVHDKRTVTKASVLDTQGRKIEIARMLGGKGDLREKLASELLDDGKSARSSAG